MVLIYFKRIMDVVSTLTGLLFTVPILLSVAFIIKLAWDRRFSSAKCARLGWKSFRGVQVSHDA